jgi:hypothetical protein
VPDPAKAGPLFRKLDALAPYPPDDATAHQVARWLAAQGLLSAARSKGGRDAFPPSLDHVHLLGAQFAAAFFLQGMTELAGMMTDPVAGRTIEAAADIMAVTAVAVWNGGDFAAPLRNLLGDGAEAAAAAADDLAEAMAGPEPEPAPLNTAESVTVSREDLRAVLDRAEPMFRADLDGGAFDRLADTAVAVTRTLTATPWQRAAAEAPGE